MTVSADNDIRLSYTGSGTTGPFTTPYFLANADIRAVKVLIADGTETVLALTTDYTLTGAGDEDGGTLTLTSSLSSSYRLVIINEAVDSQEAEYPANDPFPSATHQAVVDRRTMVSQRQRDLINRALRQPDGDSADIAALPPKVERASTALGFDSNGDPIAIDPASAVTASENVNFLQSGTGALSRTVQSKLRDTVSVKDFGAVGDGVTDDTIAIQAAITEVITLSGGGLYFPDGIYKITDELSIPASARWRIFGESRGGTIIRQFTSNKRIFRFTTADTHSWAISSMRLDYEDQQTTSDTGAIPISFMCDTGAAGAGFYNYTIDDIYFDKCYRCIAHDDANGAAAWGGAIDRVVVGEHVVGSFFYLGDSSSLGHPNNRFGSIYILADSIDASESVFNLVGCGSTVMGAIEINNAVNGPRLINAGEGTTINCQSFKLEVGNYSASGGLLFNAPDSRLCFGVLRIQTLTINPSSTNPVTILGYSAGTTGHYKVDILELIGPTITTGRLYIAQGQSSSGVTTRRAEIGFIRPSEMISNVYLTEITATAGADGASVAAWAEPRISNNKGDSDYAWAIGDATVVRYDTTLTANRTVTLPSISGSVQSSMFNGLAITVYREGLGNFRLDVVSSGGSAIDSFPPNTGGSITFMFYRFGWKVVGRYLRDAVSADNGDAAATLVVGQSSKTQRWSTTLTADRAVTLSTTGARNGDSFLITRPASGAFNLNVGTGPLKALASSTWCRVVYNGSAWMLSEYGSL